MFILGNGSASKEEICISDGGKCVWECISNHSYSVNRSDTAYVLTIWRSVLVLLQKRALGPLYGAWGLQDAAS